MRWFKHFSDAGDNKKIKKLIWKFGIEGYGVYFRTLELVAKEFENNFGNNGSLCTLSNDYDLDYLAAEMRIEPDKLKEIYDYCAQINLINAEKWEQGIIHIPQLVEYSDEYTRKTLKQLQSNSGETPDNVRTHSGETPDTLQTMSAKNRIEVDKIRSRLDQIRGRLEKKENNTTGTSEKSKSQKKYSITFNETTKRLEGITPEDIQHWQETFPDVNIKAEIKKAEAWLDANPQKRKKNYKRFLVNWFSRQQDKIKSQNPLEVNSPFELLDEVSLHNLKVAKYVEQKIIEEGQE